METCQGAPVSQAQSPWAKRAGTSPEDPAQRYPGTCPSWPFQRRMVLGLPPKGVATAMASR